MQLTDDWDERYRLGKTAWEDEEAAPATRELILANLPAGARVLELGCGRGVDSVWLAANGYRVAACDISPTAIAAARTRARAHGVEVAFFVADSLAEDVALPRRDAVFERGVLHTFVTDEARGRFAERVADLLEPGGLWLSVAGAAATRQEAEEAAVRHMARVSASQITAAVEPHFDVLSMQRVQYGFAGGPTDFEGFASVFRKRR
jgi:cyclopropane fatty-acyl-phospholipid synthase-like methyltransferase